MSRKILGKLLMLLAVLAALIIWLITLISPNTFGQFKAAYALAIICGAWGITFLLLGLFSKTNVITKKLDFFIAIGFLVATVFAVFASFGLDDKFIGVIVLIVIVAGLILGLLGTGGKAWDEGDNQKVGYKNYYERKADEEKEKAKAEKKE